MEPNTNTPLVIKNKVNKIANEYSDKEYLQNYQFIIREYLAKPDAIGRGLLLFHSPGFGKSITTASIAEYNRVHEPKRKIIVLLSKSLQDNFKGNIRKYMNSNKEISHIKSYNQIDDIIDKKYNFVSLNASNMYTQITTLDKSEEEKQYEKSLEKLNEYIGGSRGVLENSILIIDEVHNLCSGIKNGSKNAVQLYNTIMQTRDIKLLFLTGTPIVNSPFEIVPLFNMLRGYTIFNKVKYTLFPENEDKFNNFFIDRENNTIKNRSIFQNRITGLCSYYGNYYFKDQQVAGFPTEYPLVIEKVHMSETQFINYQEMRSIEEKEESSKYNSKQSIESFIDKDKSKSISSYRIRSRQVSNYSVPPYAIREYMENNKRVVKRSIHSIKGIDLKNLDKFSPKFKKIIGNIKKYPDQLAVIYSEFVDTGINLMGLVLKEVEGYIYWRDSPKNISLGEETGAEFDLNSEFSKQNTGKKGDKKVKSLGKKIKTYAIISGSVPFSERESILKVFNSNENVDGSLISVLMISKSGSEGLTLKNVRSLHIMEPFWNYARIEQVIARGSRYMSHSFLPKNQQDITPYLYVSTYPKDFKQVKNGNERTTDEELLHNSLRGKVLRDRFELSIIESSIDCNYHKLNLKTGVDCHLCLPDNKKLYNHDINADILNNPCLPLVATEKDLKKITVDSSDYYYDFDKKLNKLLGIYRYDNDIDNYIQLEKNNPVYSQIIMKVLKL
jgi:superfamily II DNA or RNA helicase